MTCRASGSQGWGTLGNRLRGIHPLRYVFELVDRRFAIYRPLQEPLVGRRHANEDNATVIRNLHRGGAE